MSNDTLIEGLDYYVENGMYVWTARYLQNRGYCCDLGCRHCPTTGLFTVGRQPKPSWQAFQEAAASVRR